MENDLRLPLFCDCERAGTNLTVYRLPWEEFERDTRPRRWLVAPVLEEFAGGEAAVLVATPEQVRELILRGPQADYTQTPSWRGETGSTRRAGGQRTQPFGKEPRLRALVQPMRIFFAQFKSEIEVVRRKGEAVEREVMTVRELRVRWSRPRETRVD